jgi:hypothetical protein
MVFVSADAETLPLLLTKMIIEKDGLKGNQRNFFRIIINLFLHRYKIS